MGKTVVHKDASGKGEHLGFILQTAEGCGEDEAVVVALKLRTVVAVLLLGFEAETLAAQKLYPIHHCEDKGTDFILMIED